jgi:hypothetical protein
MTQTGKDEALHKLDTGFNLGLVSLFAGTGRNEGSAVMGCHSLINFINARFIVTGLGDA